jgi:formylglycine-generating enzyme required for sulfatase activity
MVAIPADKFTMGNDAAGARDNEKPPHEVTLLAYCIDRTEVTTSAYHTCAQRAACTEPGRDEFCNDISKPDHPQNCVTWKQAAEFCRWAGKRLPTEAEWEYAARGTDGRLYPWGNQPPDGERLNACGPGCVEKYDHGSQPMYPVDDDWMTTSPVGSFPKGRSPLGVYDMAGNVYEFTADWFSPYDAAPKTDPTGPMSGEYHVIRGGGYMETQDWRVRTTPRFGGQDSDKASNIVGFRCARFFDASM